MINKIKENFYIIIKRFFDILFALIGCILLLIIIPIIKICFIVTGDYDKIFYTQDRYGKNKKLFKLYKFRTMIVNADNELESILKDKKLKEEWEKTQKLKNDPRITKIGKFLRNSCLDEFPQFINILKGDMSIIGPRPYLPREKSLLKNNLDIITNVRPGLTGYWQVNRDKFIDFNSRINCEKYYALNSNIFFDIKIFFKTFLLFIMK